MQVENAIQAFRKLETILASNAVEVAEQLLSFRSLVTTDLTNEFETSIKGLSLSELQEVAHAMGVSTLRHSSRGKMEQYLAGVACQMVSAVR